MSATTIPLRETNFSQFPTLLDSNDLLKTGLYTKNCNPEGMEVVDSKRQSPVLTELRQSEACSMCLYNYEIKDYSARLARFTTIDPIGLYDECISKNADFTAQYDSLEVLIIKTSTRPILNLSPWTSDASVSSAGLSSWIDENL